MADRESGGLMDGYALALAFDTDDPEFCRGVEVGRLWEMLHGTDDPIEESVQTSNAEMVLRMAEATGRAVRSEDHGPHKLWVTFDAA